MALSLRAFRKKMGWNQTEMAEKIDSTFVSISRYENGTRRTINADVVEKLFVLSKGEVDANSLFGITPERIKTMRDLRNGKSPAAETKETQGAAGA